MDKITFRKLILARKYVLKAIDELCRSDYDARVAFLWADRLDLIGQEILKAVEQQLNKEV